MTLPDRTTANQDGDMVATAAACIPTQTDDPDLAVRELLGLLTSVRYHLDLAILTLVSQRDKLDARIAEAKALLEFSPLTA
jgi:hypothetical protein